MPRHNEFIHAKATDLLIKALQAPLDKRLALVDEVLSASDLTGKDCKRIQEGVRKVCALRDQLAIQLYDVDLIDPRQLPLDFTDVRPQDFE